MKRTPYNRKNALDGSKALFPPSSLASPFTCSRCQGLFVETFCLDTLNGTGEIGFWALRCVQCGELVDPLITQHRHITPQLVGHTRRL
jgi:hypothetical protein